MGRLLDRKSKVLQYSKIFLQIDSSQKSPSVNPLFWDCWSLSMFENQCFCVTFFIGKLSGSHDIIFLSYYVLKWGGISSILKHINEFPTHHCTSIKISNMSNWSSENSWWSHVPTYQIQCWKKYLDKNLLHFWWYFWVISAWNDGGSFFFSWRFPSVRQFGGLKKKSLQNPFFILD